MACEVCFGLGGAFICQDTSDILTLRYNLHISRIPKSKLLSRILLD